MSLWKREFYDRITCITTHQAVARYGKDTKTEKDLPAKNKTSTRILVKSCQQILFERISKVLVDATRRSQREWGMVHHTMEVPQHARDENPRRMVAISATFREGTTHHTLVGIIEVSPMISWVGGFTVPAKYEGKNFVRLSIGVLISLVSTVHNYTKLNQR